jgi:hypothetical protein
MPMIALVMKFKKTGQFHEPKKISEYVPRKIRAKEVSTKVDSNNYC